MLVKSKKLNLLLVFGLVFAMIFSTSMPSLADNEGNVGELSPVEGNIIEEEASEEGLPEEDAGEDTVGEITDEETLPVVGNIGEGEGKDEGGLQEEDTAEESPNAANLPEGNNREEVTNEEESITEENLLGQNSNEENMIVTNAFMGTEDEESVESQSITSIIWAGKHINVGSVDVTANISTHEDMNKYIDIALAFALTNGWKATEYHIYVLDTEPTKEPTPGQAPYKGSLNNETNFTVTISELLSNYSAGSNIYITTHLSVNKQGKGGGNETAYGGNIVDPKKGSWFGYIVLPIPEEDEEPGDEEPGDEEPGDEEPGDEEPGDEEPGDEEPGDEEPGDEEPGDEEPGDEEPGDEEPGDEEPGDEEPGDEEPGDEEPGDEEPGDEEPGDEEPGDEEPGDEEPGDEEPGDEEPGDEEPGDEEPVDEQPEDEIIIIEDDEIPLGEPEVVEEVIEPETIEESIEEMILESEELEEEIIILDDPVPLGAPETLPQTGEGIPYLAYIFGSLVLALGIFLKKFR